MLVFVILVGLLALQSVASLMGGYRFLRLVRDGLRRPRGDFAPPASVIIPCKGLDQDFERNVSSFLSQRYPWHQVVFVVASENDPAYPVLRARLNFRTVETAKGPGSTVLVVAGYSDVRGEKVHNLVRGVAAADPRAEVLVFADIDVRPRDDWLRSLVAPLADPSVTVSTGFRWYLPGTTYASRLRAAWDTSIATMLGDHAHNFAWGGSMAMRIEDFRRLQIVERGWARTLSDDYAVTRATREVGGRIRFESRCLLASREDLGLRDFWRWSSRQIILTRVYAGHLWALGLASHALYCGTFVLGLVLACLSSSTLGERLAVAGSLPVILGLGIAKARLRQTVAREIFPEEAETLQRYGSAYWRLAPLVPWVMLLNFLAAALTRRVEWRGTRYEICSADEIRVLGRDHI